MAQDTPKKVTKRISLAAKLATRTPTMNEGSLLTNCYEEPAKQGDRAVKRPGYQFQAVVGSACQGQGAIEWNGKTIIIGCDTLWDLKYQFMRATVGQGQLGGGSQVNDPVTGVPIQGSGGSGSMAGSKTLSGGPTVLAVYFDSATSTYAIFAIASSGSSSTIFSSSLSIAGVAGGLTTFGVLTWAGASSTFYIYTRSWSLVASIPLPSFLGTFLNVGYSNGAYYFSDRSTTIFKVTEGGVLSSYVVGASIDSATAGGNYVYVLDFSSGSEKLNVYNNSLSLLASVPVSSLSGGVGIGCDSSSVYVTDLGVTQYSPSGSVLSSVPSGPGPRFGQTPCASTANIYCEVTLAATPPKNLIVCDKSYNIITQLSPGSTGQWRMLGNDLFS